MKLSANEEAILAEFIGYYWSLFAMWCEENGHTVEMPNQLGSNWKALNHQLAKGRKVKK